MKWIFKALLVLIGITNMISAATGSFKSNRILVVIDDQWKDPASYIIQDSEEFQDIVSLLKLWCIPFDILRLDQEPLTIDRFLDVEGEPAYGCIVWDANQAEVPENTSYYVLEEAVSELGIGLIAISNRIQEPVIQKLLGLKYLGYYLTPDDITVTSDHYIVRPFGGQTIPAEPGHSYQKRVQVSLSGSEAIASQGSFPQITAREIEPHQTRVVWIGGDYRYLFHEYTEMRTVLKRALTWCVGYSVYKSYPRTIMVKLDDPGTAQASYLSNWNYPSLTKQQIKTYLIEPLQKYNCVMNMHVCSGFVNSKTRRVESPWKQKFTDVFGNVHDYSSTKAGLLEGVRVGVFEIQSHGWTHMQPDLDSPPGPWWDAPTEGEKSEVGWYREFYDTRRDKEIPAAVQLFHLQKGLKGIQTQFDVNPLSVRPGGGAYSSEYPNNTLEIAARLGFGTQAGFHFLSHERIIDFSSIVGKTYVYFDKTDGLIAQFNQDDYPVLSGMHDRDVYLDSNFVYKCLEALGTETKYMSNNEAVAYWHSQIRAQNESELVFEYDPHYCYYFKDHPSTWTFEISDWLFKSLIGKSLYSDDGTILVKKLATENLFELRPGLGRQKISIH